MTTIPFSFAGRRPAVVTIDCHRGHLDPAVATMPIPADRARAVIQRNVELLDQMRAENIPVIHVMTAYRGAEEISKNAWWKAVADTSATRRNVLFHQVSGSPGLEIMPELLAPTDILISTKKRYDCFVATDLDHVLRAHDIDTLIMTGINTNSCVLATTVSANVRDYAAIVVRECVDTMDLQLHEAALNIIDGAFGWTMSIDEVVNSIKERQLQ